MQIDEHYLAFIDILGFSDKVIKDFNKAEIDESSNLYVLIEAIKRARESAERNIEIIQFSDSIILSTPFKRENFNLFIKSCANIQAELIQMKILLRGGITYGKHYSKDGIIYSRALIDAYILESTEAIYPRILISDELIKLIYENDSDIINNELISVDADRLHYANYMRLIDRSEIVNIKQYLSGELEKHKGRIAAKYSWALSRI